MSQGKRTVRVIDGSTGNSYEPTVIIFGSCTFSEDGTILTITPSGGGGGTSNHALLSSLGWSASGHTGTYNRVAGFNGAGAATYLTGSDVLGYVLTGAGDLAYGDGAGGATRLPIPSADRFLTSTTTAPQWSTASDVRALLDLEVGVDIPSYTDPRLSNARTPTVHASSHQHGGSDEVATATPAANAIPKANGSGLLDSWISAATTLVKGLIQLAGDLGGTATSPTVVQARGLRETSGPTTLTMNAVSDGQYLKRSGSTIVGVAGTAVTGFSGDPFSVWSGDTSRGAVTFDGTTAVTGFSLASRVYTLTANENLSYTTATLDTTGGDIEIICKGAPFRAKSIVGVGSGNAKITFSGSAAAGTVGGAAAAALTDAPLRGGTAGANGRATTGAGASSTGPASGVSLGGYGGKGGVGGASAGGSSGAPTRPYDGGVYGDMLTAMFSLAFGGSNGSTWTFYQITGGSGGGAGGVTATTGTWNSGGAGGGAGCIGVFANTISMGSATLQVQAIGGPGANALAGTTGSAGGGEGGGGGVIFFAARTISGTVTLDVSGGPGGNGAGSAGAGGDGGQGGRVLAIYGTGTAPTVTVAGGAKGTDAGAPGTPAANGASGTGITVVL